MRHRSFALLLLAAVAAAATAAATAVAAGPATKPSDDNTMVLIPAGTYMMGRNDGFPYEGPTHEVSVKSFWIDKHPVTVAEFAKFVQATHFKTDAEKFGWSGVFDIKTHGWTKVDNVNWQHPEGPSAPAAPLNQPVTQVSFADAQAYAKWAGKRLPTEAEFEYAERGGLKEKTYAWGDEEKPQGKYMANYWQGHFPEKNTSSDGFESRAPVESFPPNGYGLYDMTGNVWEWCSDFFAPDYYLHSPKDNPQGPDSGDEHVLRGGSWLCSSNYCVGYQVGTRQHTAPDSGLNNLGFRCVKDADK